MSEQLNSKELKDRSQKLWEEVQLLSKQWDKAHEENKKRLAKIKKNMAQTRKLIEQIQASNVTEQKEASK